MECFSWLACALRAFSENYKANLSITLITEAYLLGNNKLCYYFYYKYSVLLLSSPAGTDSTSKHTDEKSNTTGTSQLESIM